MHTAKKILISLLNFILLIGIYILNLSLFWQGLRQGSSSHKSYLLACASSAQQSVIAIWILVKAAISMRSAPCLLKTVIICSPLKSGTTSLEAWFSSNHLPVLPYVIGITAFAKDFFFHYWLLRFFRISGFVLSDLPSSSVSSLRRLYDIYGNNAIYIYSLRPWSAIEKSWSKHKSRNNLLRPGFLCILRDDLIVKKYERQMRLSNQSADSNQFQYARNFENLQSYLSRRGTHLHLIDTASDCREITRLLWTIISPVAPYLASPPAEYSPQNIGGSGDHTF